MLVICVLYFWALNQVYVEDDHGNKLDINYTKAQNTSWK